MKKVSLFAIFSAMFAMAANAEFVAVAPAGGFVDGNETIVTVDQVKNLRDDVPVVMMGKIVKSMGDEMYLFEDATGTIRVEIDDDDWRGQTVTPNDTVKLRGEVDAGIFTTEVDVDVIEKQ